jgi:3-dehydroquinate dehydratase
MKVLLQMKEDGNLHLKTTVGLISTSRKHNKVNAKAIMSNHFAEMQPSILNMMELYTTAVASYGRSKI